MKPFKKKFPNYMLNPVQYEPKDQFVEGLIKLLCVKTCSTESIDKIVEFLIEREKIYLEHRGKPTFIPGDYK